MNDKLKKVIFDKLYMNLSNAEVIDCDRSIWFIDREEKYWYLEYEKSGELWWRLPFFEDFFLLFSMERDEYEPIIIEWVEEVLNCKVTTSFRHWRRRNISVEEVLNCKVTTSSSLNHFTVVEVEEVLNCKVTTSRRQ